MTKGGVNGQRQSICISREEKEPCPISPKNVPYNGAKKSTEPKSEECEHKWSANNLWCLKCGKSRVQIQYESKLKEEKEPHKEIEELKLTTQSKFTNYGMILEMQEKINELVRDNKKIWEAINKRGEE